MDHRGLNVNPTVVHNLCVTREDPQLKIRMPGELKSLVEAAAKSAGRSVTAEVVARLQQSFDNADEVRRLLLDEDKRLSGLDAEVPEGVRQQLYILLDTNGYVVSWAEVQAILAALRKAGNFNPAEMHTEIITPDLESSTRRTEQVAALARKLRAGGRSLVIKADEA